MSSTAPATPAAPKTEKGTAYIVLKLLEGTPQTWRALNTPTTATSAQAAIRKTTSDDGGEYVAIPARSWKPVKVTVETTKTVRLGEA